VVGGKAPPPPRAFAARVEWILVGLAAFRWKLATVAVSPVSMMPDEIGAAGVADGQNA